MPSSSRSRSLPAWPDERVALLVLVEAGRLADEHQVGVRVPDAEDDLRAALGEPALHAAGGLIRVLPEFQRARRGIHGRRVYALLRTV